MTVMELRTLVAEWDSYPNEGGFPTAYFQRILDRLEWFGGSEWSRYLPAEHPDYSPSYLVRLAKWIGNVTSEKDRQLLLQYAINISFFTHADFSALYQSAFNGPISQWVIEQSALRLGNKQFREILKTELYQSTWYCPITDSMDINEFYHVNHITGINHRPAFLSATMGDQQSAIKAFMNEPSVVDGKKSPSLRRLVLLEDFVGTGNQVKKAIEWAAASLDVPILFVPLIICPSGIQLLSRLQKKYPGRIDICPVIRLKACDLLGPKRKSEQSWVSPSEAKIEDLAKRIHKQVTGNVPIASDKENSPFGFLETGCSVVTFTNTPNNSLPMIHNHPVAETWNPLFPRSSRN